MTWVLIRGLTREATHWADFPEQLASATGQLVLTPDLAGNGALCRDTSPASVDGLLDALQLHIADQGIELPVNVLAMSLGGMVATHWAQREPHEVERLVLINTSMRPFSKLTERLRPGSWLTLVKLALWWGRADKAEKIENSIQQLTCHHTHQRTKDITAWSGIRISAPVSAANALRQLWAAARFACKPAPPACPALVLSSKGDRLVNPDCSIQLSTAWQLPHRQHPGAGHDLPHDDGAWVCQQINQWLMKEY